MNLFLQLLANGIVNGALFAVLAIGFGLVFRSIGVFHVAYGANAVLAAMLFYSLVVGAGLNWWIAGSITVILSAGAGWAMEAAFYRPFHNRKTASGAVLVASLGLAIVIENTLALIYGNEIRSIPREFAQSMSMGSVRLTTIQVVQFLTCGGILSILALARNWRFFLIIRAMGENPQLLEVNGWRLGEYRALVLALSGVCAAIPACLIMVDGGMDVHAGLSYLLIAAVAVLAGGVPRMEAWVLGGFLLAILQSLVVWQFSAKWMDLVAFVLLIAVLLFRRDGILSIRRRMEES